MADTTAQALANVQMAIANVSSLIVQVTSNPQPSYSVQGVSVSASEYLATLTKELLDLQELMIALSGPYQLVTQAVT